MRAPLGASVTLLEATTPVKLPTKRCPRFRVLASRQQKGRISTSAPRELASPLHSLRPILHISGPDATLSYSKGSRGLFVPSRVIGIFTDTTISLRSWLRQCPDHYTIRAGRNLPDKEFRYLRTVIVTAAGGLATLHSPVFLVNSCLDLFSAPPSLEDPLFRSYGVSLPSSLTMILSSASVYSTQPPVSVYGTGSYNVNV